MNNYEIHKNLYYFEQSILTSMTNRHLSYIASSEQ